MLIFVEVCEKNIERKWFDKIFLWKKSIGFCEKFIKKI